MQYRRIAESHTIWGKGNDMLTSRTIIVSGTPGPSPARRQALRQIMRLGLAFSAFGSFSVARGADAAEESARAKRVATTVDGLEVESHWPAGVHVQWETGVPDGRPERAEGKHTHCSAFVASAAMRLGVYILRPPEHPQALLANAQYDWLGSDEGERQGWRAVHGGVEAQALANRGKLVVATYRNHHDDKPGHIAIVRPSDKSESAILREGPEITQAGSTNYRSTSLRQGFAGHPAAWSKGEIRYYAHEID
jgi:hypothetical protein